MFKVSEFLNHFEKHKDFARTSKFEVRITSPSGIQLDTMPLRLQCESTELPGYNVNTVDNRYYGVAEPIASAPTSFADITLTFICAGDMWEKKLFDRWINFIVPINNYNPRYKDDYSSQIEISQFDGVATSDNPVTQTATRIYYAKLFGAFPVSIGTLSLNWADDGIHRLPVTFRYDYWLPGPENLATTTQEQKKDSKPNGSTPPATGNRGQPTTPPRITTPTTIKPQPIRGGGGKFAGGGASGSF
jgi:uncharacterized membrane protein YgcG